MLLPSIRSNLDMVFPYNRSFALLESVFSQFLHYKIPSFAVFAMLKFPIVVVSSCSNFLIQVIALLKSVLLQFLRYKIPNFAVFALLKFPITVVSSCKNFLMPFGFQIFTFFLWKFAKT